MRATQESRVTVRREDEVHDIHDEVWQLATRLDGLEERIDGHFRRVEERIDENDRMMRAQFDHVKDWCKGVATTMGQIMGQLEDIRAIVQPEREKNRKE